MHLNFLAFAVPFFASLMWLEYYYTLKKGKQYHHFEEAVANINVGIAERLSDVFVSGLFYFFFDWVYKNFSLFELPRNPLTWVLLFLLTDFAWYWYHRLGHEVSLFWSVHVVHHQSEDFNYTTSARITVFQAVVRCLFWSILPIVGFHPNMIVTFLMFHASYSFFTHTQLVGKLGFLEYFLVTPSHYLSGQELWGCAHYLGQALWYFC
jgi:alkylglycerol monooxygenase